MILRRLQNHKKSMVSMMVLVIIMVWLAPQMALAQDSTVWTVEFFDNNDFSGLPLLTRTETQTPNFNWGSGSPAPQVPIDHFSARWWTIPKLEAGHYRFTVRADDGVRLWVNNKLLIDQWHTQSATTYTVDHTIQQGGSVPIVLQYYENMGNAEVALNWNRIGHESTSGPVRAEYFNNRTLSGQPAYVRYEGVINHDWGNGSPVPGKITSDNFSARYTTMQNLLPGRYRFTIAADDGFRLWINKQLVADAWHDSPASQIIVERDLAGGLTSFVVEYYDNVGLASLTVNSTQLGGPVFILPGDTPDGSGGLTLPDSTGQMATVNTAYLNMRSGPGVSYDVITALSRDTKVELTGEENGLWVFIKLADGRLGWVSRRYLDFNGDENVDAVG